MFSMRTFGREASPRLIGRRESLGEAHRSSVTVCLDGWDVDALLSGRPFLAPHESALPLQLVTAKSYVGSNPSGSQDLVPFLQLSLPCP